MCREPGEEEDCYSECGQSEVTVYSLLGSYVGDTPLGSRASSVSVPPRVLWEGRIDLLTLLSKSKSGGARG